jgi:hypothetical protein
MYTVSIPLNGIIKFVDDPHKRMVIPYDPANRDYSQIIQDIILIGPEVFEDGQVPESIQADADAWLFEQKMFQYEHALSRLSQYELSKGCDEITEMRPGMQQVVDPDTGDLVNEMFEVVIQLAIEPLPLTVTITNFDGTTAEVDNPLVLQDQEERANAQAVIDATPEEVKTAYEEMHKS